MGPPNRPASINGTNFDRLDWQLLSREQRFSKLGDKRRFQLSAQWQTHRYALFVTGTACATAASIILKRGSGGFGPIRGTTSTHSVAGNNYCAHLTLHEEVHDSAKITKQLLWSLIPIGYMNRITKIYDVFSRNGCGACQTVRPPTPESKIPIAIQKTPPPAPRRRGISSYLVYARQAQY